MLKLADFFHLPQVDALFDQIMAPEPGLIVVAGLDPRPASGPTEGGFPPSGRATLFRILVHEFMEANASAQCAIVAEDKDALRTPRAHRHRTAFSVVQPPFDYPDRIMYAADKKPDLLVVDKLTPDTLPPMLDSAQNGMKVLSQLDTVFRGAGVIQHLRDLGASPEQLQGVAWVVAVQRISTLCPECKQSAPLTPEQTAHLYRMYPHWSQPLEARYWADGCERCNGTGRYGDSVLFDVFRARAEAPHVLPMAEYVLHLAMLGHLSLDDVTRFEADQFQRTYQLLVNSERALVGANDALEQKLAELEASNRVLQQRTKALISLQGIAQALISSADLDDLAARICRHARDLCGADRAVLYFLHSPDEAEVMAIIGWERSLLHRKIARSELIASYIVTGPVNYTHYPPGVPPRPKDVEGAALRAGLYVPLIAQDEHIGLMIVHSTRKNSFTHNEVSLLQAFANQASLAMQRAGLIENLRTKIELLEKAQVELAQKERLERELELARQVQQSALPMIFPAIPGYRFTAHNEPARQVGGDFYDVIALDDDHFGVAVADVSDKGLAAAMYMALTRSLLRAEARRECSAVDVLASVNELLLELSEPNMFVTVFYGVVECSTRQMTYTRAGHDRPVLLRGGTIEELKGKGLALGLMEKDSLFLSEEQITLEAGDRLIFYTDGLTDVPSPDGKLFGREQVKTLFQACAKLPLNRLCSAVFAALESYRGEAEQFDDMTMLAMEVG